MDRGITIAFAPTEAFTEEEKRLAVQELYDKWDEVKTCTTATELAIEAGQFTTSTTIPKEYTDFAKVFSKEESQRFPPLRPWDHAIEFKKDAPDAIHSRALAPKSYIFGIFGLGPASRGSAAIPVSRSHGVLTIAPSLSPSANIHTHTHSLSLSLSPSLSIARLRLTPQMDDADRHSKPGRAFPRLVSSLSSRPRLARLAYLFQDVKTTAHPL
ncbi:hypothetical protein EDB84DRAFT_1649977 [Lactarius hengduanensis]|nr:hypothetical protein EDB84DRAFT_1649977 [Lactarius hengduanensis]